ncbi:IS481 family transposase [Arthrobacter psychrolactophilus]|uniref:IS481 family transposase n=1 Tax=Arthrobacter psychrolactophilus TaxID=92442 RepID=A0A2V5ISS8_9MICC|nr:IS481 family transposase [Arthrobacter psychrolactophilus]
MEKNKLIIQSIIQGKLTPAQAAEHFGVSRRWVYELMRRHRASGEDGVLPLSRRPHSSPQQTAETVRSRILSLRPELTDKGLDAGAETSAWHLSVEGLAVPAASTIHRILRSAGLVTDQPHKRPRSSWHRFEATQPNEMWQSDFTHWTLASGADVEILNFLDDHSRYLISCTAHQRVTGPLVLECFLQAAERYGFPASTLTDNGMVFTTRLSGGKGGLNAFEKTLRDLGIQQKNGSPSHPQTQGKIERFHQTLKHWLTIQDPAKTLVKLNKDLIRFAQVYNTERPHRALNRRTPAQAYEAVPKATPTNSEAGTHHRVRTDKIDAGGKVSLRYQGKLLHLGVGRQHMYEDITVLVADTAATVILTSTGEILGEYNLDATKNYQAKKKKSPAKAEDSS